MRYMKRFLFSVCCCGMLCCQASAQSTQKLSASKANDYGIMYSLPATVLKITLEAERTECNPGEFYKYARRYLGTSDAVATPSVQWRLLGATVTSEGVIDTGAEKYLMQLKSASNPFLLIDENGLPLALNTDQVMAKETVELPEPRPASPTALDGPAARQAVTAEMVQSSSTAKRAELAAARIMEIRSSRNDYLTGQADQMPDGSALKLILSNLDAQEEALTAMFLGTQSTSTEVVTLTYMPKADVTDEVIARLSRTEGIVDADDLRGVPIYISVDVTSRGKMPVNDKGETKAMPKGGVAYCIPGSANVTVSTDGRTLDSVDLTVAQFGVVYGLDPALFTSKKAPSYVIFDSVTGGIREIGTLTE